MKRPAPLDAVAIPSRALRGTGTSFGRWVRGTIHGLSVAIAALALATTASASPEGAYRLAGTWVPAQIFRDLEAGATSGAPGCHLLIFAEPLGVQEICPGWSGAWQGPLRLEEERGRVQLEGRASAPAMGVPAAETNGFGAEGRRVLVARAGAPNELELRWGAGPRSPEGMQRLYRIDAGQVEALQAWMERGGDSDGKGPEPASPPRVDESPEPASEKVAIAEPIAPKPRICGCGAAEGAGAGGALLPALAWLALSRRRRPCSTT
ncbi:MAG TPA: hypothetical protein VGD74_13060 [Vulgatibacter sp.]